MTGIVQISTTLDTEQAAQELADALVAERLAACVQVIGPVRSTYRWEGAVERATEWLCVAKTTVAAVNRLTTRIRQLHSYTQPEILATPVVGGDDGYLNWVRSEVRAP